MGFFSFTVAGGGFILIGAWEALISSNSTPDPNPPSPLHQINNTSTKSSISNTKTNPSSSSLTFIAISVFSFLFMLNSLVSFFDALNSRDGVGSALQLQVLAIASLFFLYSILGLLVNFSNSILLPSSLLNLIALCAFVEEFLLFYLQRKDPSGIENRYFDLLLVPISICVVSTILELKSSKSIFSRLARGVGLILQGTWFVQMGLSFYTNLMVHGCSLSEKSRGNYTIRCKGHPEYHRGRAIATLQFNLHLALLMILVVGTYSIMAKRNEDRGDFTSYRPIGAEMQPLENHSRFTLDSDEDVDDEIKEEDNASKQKAVIVEAGVNGYGSHE